MAERDQRGRSNHSQLKTRGSRKKEGTGQVRDGVLIVGGGIAGLATAAALTESGIACEVVERTESWAPIGAGIVLGVNAMRVMRGLGLDTAVDAAGARLAQGALTNHHGEALQKTDFSHLEPELGPTVALHRAALHSILMEAIPNVNITLGTSIESFKQNEECVEVRLTNGLERRYGLVLGADGLRSRVRELMFDDERIQYSGYTCWRLVTSVPVERTEMCEMWGAGKRFGIVPIGKERVYCFAVANSPRGAPDPATGRVERFRERFSGFGGRVPEILDSVRSPDDLIHNDLEELAEGPWHDGRLLLIGDAAHALTPNMGQGAAMALEDSMVLAEILREGASAKEIGPRFQARRAPRVQWVQDQSRRVGRIAQIEGALVRGLRNTALRAMPNSANLWALRKMALAPI